MNVTNAMKEAIRSVVNQKFDPLRKPYQETIDRKNAALDAIKERACKAYEEVMLEAYTNAERVPHYGNYDNNHRAAYYGLKSEFDVTEEWQALGEISKQVEAAVSGIITRLTLMSKVDILGVIEKYFEENPVA